MMTTKVTSTIVTMLVSPAILTSAVSAAGPVRWTRTPGGGDEPSTMPRTAATDSFDSVSPMFPARLSATYTAWPSLLCALASVSGSPHMSWMLRTCSGSASSLSMSCS